MRIGVLGTGMVGRAISGRLAELGHDVKVGSRTEGDGKVVFAGAANLAGKLLVDVSNPLDFSSGGPGLFTTSTDSLGERIQAAFPAARVVKALNTINCNVMVDPGSVPGDHVVFVCGNDEEARAHASALITELGFPKHRIIDLGDITGARGAEQYVMLWVRLVGVVGSPRFNISLSTMAP